MSLTQLGALGEFVGAIAVLITLVFLVVQIRQNTKVSRSILIQHWNLAVAPQNLLVASDPEVAKLLIEYADDPRSLDRFERNRMRGLLLQMFNNFELLFLQNREGTIDTTFFEGKITIYLELLYFPGIRWFWEHEGPKFLDPRFRAFVDSRLESEH